MTLYSYNLMGGLAAILGVILSFWKLKTYHIGLWRWLLPPAMAIFAFVGARIWNYSVNPGQFGENFPIWKLYYGNLSLYGGLLGPLLVLMGISYIKRISFLHLLDAFVLPGGLSIVLLKMGCFLNGCCFGKRTSSIFGMIFPASASASEILGKLPFFGTLEKRVHPTQLYEVIGLGICLLLVLILMRKVKLPKGGGGLLFIILLTLVRLAVHPFRIFSYADIIIKYIYPAIYLGIILTCSIMMYSLFKRGPIA